MSVGGEDKCFHANNHSLAVKFSIDKANVRRHFRELLELGLILEKRGENPNKRCYLPSDDLLRACQIDNLAITNLVRAAVAATKPKKVVKTTTPVGQNDNPREGKMTTPLGQNDNHNVLEQCVKENVSLNSVLIQCREELLAANAAVDLLTKKNAELESRLATGLSLHAAQKKEIARLKTELANASAPHTGAAKDVSTPKAEKIPVYSDVVEIFHEAHKSIMGVAVIKFSAREGSELKQVITALKKIEGIGTWEGAAELFRAICMNWIKLGKWYKDKFSTAILNGKLNEIVATLRLKSDVASNYESTIADFENR